MKSKWMAFLIDTLLAALSGTTAARDQVSFSISFGAPAVAYVTPAPVYYYPPQAIYYAPPSVYYVPAPWAVRVGPGQHRGWHNGHRHHR